MRGTVCAFRAHPREGCVTVLCALRERERAEWLLWPPQEVSAGRESLSRLRASRHWKTRVVLFHTPSCQPRRHRGSDVASTLGCAGRPASGGSSPRGGLRCVRASRAVRSSPLWLMAVSACSNWRPGAPSWWGGPGGPGAACASAARSSGP